MPRRQSRSRSAPVAQQRRSVSTVPTRQTPPPQSQQRAPAPRQQQQTGLSQPNPSSVGQPAPKQPGLFAQMASTAAGVAVGSTIGHTMGAGISGMFGGHSNSAPTEAEPTPFQTEAQPTPFQTTGDPALSCEADSKAFIKCLEATNNNMTACQYYFDALKACQQMASQY
ncbi:hypothetical protein BC937DRAFT_88816 [Endogone sp. FLAS-F59071]|nr:hypothetical protein BC937DRAFT_88816 [Endogone sp. FLAS-F59071]|eukprot:RUS18395.1 hypothetical protein BC937DRAFT_88816 [Endogone sp. FLAS-F59071]